MVNFQVTTDWLRARSSATPAAIALIDCTSGSGEGSWSFKTLDQLVDQLCRKLIGRGVLKGSHVAIALSNSLSYVSHIFALARIGACLVPINTRLTANEISQQVARADCAFLIMNASTASINLQLSPFVAEVILIPDKPDDFVAWLNGEPVIPYMIDEPTPGLSEIQSIMFTSGTTGRQKGAMLSFANHYWSAIASAFRIGVLPTDRWLLSLPLYHVGGLAIVFRSCLYGTAIVLHDGFEIRKVLDSLRNQSISLVSLVPTMLYRLLHENLTASDDPSLRAILLGGAAASSHLLKAASQAGLPVALTYGLTEAASQVATSSLDQTTHKPGTVGRAQLFTAVKIASDDGRITQPGEIGDILVSGPTVMAGYYNDAQATAAALRNNWLITGDLGYLDEDGDLWIVDRREDLIVSGGENVYPAEVEAVLKNHPAVADACIVGIPDEEWGRRVVAVVIPNPGNTVTVSELMEYCRQHIAGFKKPREIRLTDELPRTSSGKIKRNVVAERYQLGQDAS